MPIMPANISESIDITENGSHNVAKYTTANVSVDPVVESLNVTPTISAQSLTPTTGVDGFNEVNVSAVTSSIDNNIQASNIKSGVSILGVTGNVIELKGETREVTPTTSQQTITPSGGKNGMTSVTVNAVTSSIDANITASNIKKNVSILGVTGSYEGSGSGGIGYGIELNDTGVLKPKSTMTTLLDFSNITEIDQFALANAYKDNKTVSGTVDFSKVTKTNRYSLYRAFDGCTGLTGAIDFSNLTNIGGDNDDMGEGGNSKCGFVKAFSKTNITSANFSKLQYVYGYKRMYMEDSCYIGNYSTFDSCFAYCSNLTSVDFSSLRYIHPQALRALFQGCTKLTSVDFSDLKQVEAFGLQYAFSGCNSIKSITFPKLQVLRGASLQYAFDINGTEADPLHVYFPAAKQADEVYMDDEPVWYNDHEFYSGGPFFCGFPPKGVVVHFPSNLQSRFTQHDDWDLYVHPENYQEEMWEEDEWVDEEGGESEPQEFVSPWGQILFDLPAA